MITLNIAARYCGLPEIGHGGYVAGMLAHYVSQPVRIRFRAAPPLNTPLAVECHEEGGVSLSARDVLVAEAEHASLELPVPPPPTYLAAVNASRHYKGFEHHPFPRCFVCGTERARGEGLRVFAGPVPGTNLVAAPWSPDESLAEADRIVRREFVFAALDCPGYYATQATAPRLVTAEFHVQAVGNVHAGESHIVIGWPIGATGRRYQTGTAIFDAHGDLKAKAYALWVATKPAD
jgi:hypothetical protein